MFPSHSPAIYEFLKEQRLVDPAQLDELNEEHKATGKPLADVVVDLGLVEREVPRFDDFDGLGPERAVLPELPRRDGNIGDFKCHLAKDVSAVALVRTSVTLGHGAGVRRLPAVLPRLVALVHFLPFIRSDTWRAQRSNVSLRGRASIARSSSFLVGVAPHSSHLMMFINPVPCPGRTKQQTKQ